MIQETQGDDARIRQNLRALTVKLVPSQWSVIRLLLFQKIDRASPEEMISLRNDIKNLLA